MPIEQWERVQAIFAAVADLPRAEQRGAIEDGCGHDAALVETVLALLEEDAHPYPLLDQSLEGMAGNALANTRLRSLVRQEIGPYRLLRLLGEGGMGIVYLAERTDIGGLVALKLLRDAWLSPMRRERFTMEQQMLSQLNHSGIARIYDAGTLQDGVPWFVMEYADGQPLTSWLERRNDTLREDLRLFRDVCEAVRYAHQHAIIHRDLKPSNILVTDTGEVKLLDFGIAKHVDEGVDKLQTVAGLRLMTPAYAAPEQRHGGSVGVFTDVYALGVLLYEILTGALPPETDAHGTGVWRPSATAAERFRKPSAAIARWEWAELDVLCLTATEPEPEHRYRSVDALLHDLDAFLEGRVLLARPRGFRYAAGKFIRRHRTAIVSAAAGLAVLIAAVVLFTVNLARSRNAALAAAARTARIQRFTETLFNGGDPGAGPAVDLKITDLLKRGEVEAEGMRDDPPMQADLFTTLGEVYQRIGQLDRADALLRRGLDQRLHAGGGLDRHYGESLVAMGLLRKDQGRMDDAEALLRQGLALYRQTLPRGDPAIERGLWALGSVLNLHGQYPESRKLLEEAAGYGSASRPGTPQLADDLVQLADVDFYLGDYAPAKDMYERALGIYRAQFGDRHPSVAQTLNSLGNLYENQGQAAQAEAYFRQSLYIDEAWYGPDHPRVASDLTSLAQVFEETKRYDQARQNLERALAIQQHAHGPVHPQVALAFNALGTLAYARDQSDESERDLRQALAIWLKVYGEHHQFVGICYANLAGTYMLRKDYGLAEQMFRQALRVYATTLPEEHLNPAVAHVKLGRVLLRLGRYAEAEPETIKGYRYFARHGAPSGSYLIGARHDLGEIEAHLNQPQKADQLRAELEPPEHVR